MRWRGGGDRQLEKVTPSTPLKTTFYTSFDFSSSLRQCGFMSDTSPGSPKSLHILSGQYFRYRFCPAALTFLLWSVPTPQPQPTLTRLQRAAERILIHSSSALSRHVRCCWSSGWVQEGFVGFFFFNSFHSNLKERRCSKCFHLILTYPPSPHQK